MPSHITVCQVMQAGLVTVSLVVTLTFIVTHKNLSASSRVKPRQQTHQNHQHRCTALHLICDTRIEYILASLDAGTPRMHFHNSNGN